MREKIKCPQCGLVQWREDACKRCRLSFAAPPSAASPPAAPPPAGPVYADPSQAASPPQAVPPPVAPPQAAPSQVAASSYAAPTPVASPPAAPMTDGSLNPYAPPAASLQPSTSAVDSPYGAITENMVQEFERGRPWMRFLAILGYIFGALQVVAAIAMAFTLSSSEVPGGPLIALIYLAAAWMYYVFASRLSKSATAIEEIRQGGGAEAITQAIHHQSSFWRLMGIISLVGLLVMVVIVLIAIVVAASSS